LPGVTILDNHDVGELIATDGRVTGTMIVARRTGELSAINADLVVDAMGRGAHTPAFLDRLGYGRPAEEGNVVHVTYTSQLLRIPAPAPAAKLFLIGGRPGRNYGSAFAACENDTWILTAVGFAGLEPPTEWPALLEFTAQCAPAEMMSALNRAEPIGAPARYRYPTGQRRRYDRMRRFPDGLVVFGDAMCSFNPVYGQGISVAALEAVALRNCLAAGAADLSRRFFTAAAKPIGVAWQLASAAELAVPETKGDRTVQTRFSWWYTNRVAAVSTADVVVYEQFIRVMNLMDPPSRLLTPAILRRVLAPRRRNARSDNPSEVPIHSTATSVVPPTDAPEFVWSSRLL
jgi:2-polyprenyl-6-methoxyphenol hydroxylase-like FAD-dependent oxidoreductase